MVLRNFHLPNSAARVQITEGPPLELFRDNLAIIGWTPDQTARRHPMEQARLDRMLKGQ
jgi:hypothetical protein